MKTINCDYCGKPFNRYVTALKLRKNHFCSKQCYYKWNSGRDSLSWCGGKVKVFCDWCGKEIYRTQSRAKRNKYNFCNRECAAKGRFLIDHKKGKEHSAWRGGKIKVFCSYCKKELYIELNRMKRSKNYFCSQKCSGQWKAANAKGENSATYKSEKVNCGWCGTELFRCPSRTIRTKNNFCNRDCQGQWKSANETGENSTNWKGGLTLERYCPTWTDKEFKNYILERDKFKCQNPECLGTNDTLCRHHIDYDKKNCIPSNIITVCSSCNTKANVNREWHQAYYGEIMRRKLECAI